MKTLDPPFINLSASAGATDIVAFENWNLPLADQAQNLGEVCRQSGPVADGRTFLFSTQNQVQPKYGNHDRSSCLQERRFETRQGTEPVPGASAHPFACPAYPGLRAEFLS
ncbi:MAG: hypothetical protein L6Q45_07745 [Anaerolineales bacterium]|nr:hypothetical protein [Anaerolineales bacterium]